MWDGICHWINLDSLDGVDNAQLAPQSYQAVDLGSRAASVDRLSVGMLRGLLELAGLGLVQVNQHDRITAWNEGATALLGWCENEAVGSDLSAIFSRGELTSPDGGAAWPVSSFTRAEVPVEYQVFESCSDEAPGERFILLADVTEKKFLRRALLEAADREQRRIGQDLHDHLCQHLLGAAFAAKAQAGALERENSSHASELHELARLINDAVSQVRDISRGLHPVELDSAGLMSAFQELAHRVSGNVPCSFVCDKNVLVQDSQRALHAYRIGQDAVSNAMQHTKPTRIVISLAEAGQNVLLEISSDGPLEGELTSEKNGTMARTLLYRAQAINGTISATFQRGKGTMVSCSFPQSS